MDLRIDANRGRKVADSLYRAFSTTGIHGRSVMPEDITPKGVERGSLEHLLFITLSVSIDYQRDADQLWRSARKTFEDPETAYLFDPESLHKTPRKKQVKDLQKHSLSKKQNQDQWIWSTVGVTFYKKWADDPRNFLEDCGWDATKVLERLKRDTHRSGNKPRTDYPFLRGPKIAPLWLRMLRDNVGLEKLKNLDEVPIPVDRHVARATLATGVVRGTFKGGLEDLFQYIRRAWFQSVEGLEVSDRPMIALDVDEPLWHLSKYGCTKRDKMTGECPVSETCEASEFCVKGKVVVREDGVELET